MESTRSGSQNGRDLLSPEQIAALRAQLDALPLEIVDRRLPASLTRFRGRSGAWRTKDDDDLFDLTVWDGVTRGPGRRAEKAHIRISLFSIENNHVVTECRADLVTGEFVAAQGAGNVRQKGNSEGAFGLLAAALGHLGQK
ncbi:hypothetical protein I0C86_40150 [Plantactinospora sp. S1510]|uniref:Uncharacterized protein n=1 Tax=Plantactinospora alkalitolerans TaxID=2789879 RepID=A0ABS0H9D5_9ACTN|nr:hypothetical protein [Plantactinospora alkalitolerans]MBF9135092.1 hypothetical protein [Plantactinospora alkalitolerans]